jgi:uroporphyrinogen-III synthase
MKSKIVAILETRTGAHLAEMVTRRGGTAMSAPALEEVPDIEPAAVIALLDRWRARAFDTVIFQTGVGTAALFAAADVAGVTDTLLAQLAAARTVVRGPKPTAALNARRVRIDIRAQTPFTTETVLDALSGVDLSNSAVLVQRYGAANQKLTDALRQRGAAVEEIATYRWALPADCGPLERLLDALRGDTVDAVVFTSAVQIHNLVTVARAHGTAEDLAACMNRRVIASIGPVCSTALRHYGITPTFEASPPKLGPLIEALNAALTDGGIVGRTPTNAC